MQFKTANKINGFKPVSYGLAVKVFHAFPKSTRRKNGPPRRDELSAAHRHRRVFCRELRKLKTRQ
jgi:hypothetical protein